MNVFLALNECHILLFPDLHCVLNLMNVYLCKMSFVMDTEGTFIWLPKRKLNFTLQIYLT